MVRRREKEPEMLYVGVDTHKSASQLTVVDKLSEVLQEAGGGEVLYLAASGNVLGWGVIADCNEVDPVGLLFGMTHSIRTLSSA